MASILGMGCIAYDMLAVIEDLPSWERLEYIKSYEVQQGGMAATAAVAASVLGADVEFIGSVGDDAEGEFHVRNFGRYGVSCDRLRVVKGEKSPFTFVLVEKGSGKRIFFHYKGVQDRDELDIEDSDFRGARFLLLDGFYFGTALRAARKARAEGVITITDTSMRNRDPRLPEYLDQVDYPVLSEVFATGYSGIADPLEAGKRLLKPGNRALIVTRGAEGLHIITGEGCEFVEAFPVAAVDTTGAGDVFHGAFAFGLWKGYDPARAAVFASAVSALKCTRMGGQSGIPSFAETKDFIIKNRPECGDWL